MSEIMLKVDKNRTEAENRWYIIRKVTVPRKWFLPDKVTWVAVTCKEVGYPRYGRSRPTDIAYFFDDFCASCAVMRMRG